eukprot:gene19352-biopygen15735
MLNAHVTDDLWQLTRVAKGIWQPKLGRVFTKLFLEEGLTYEELTDKAFTTWQVTVHFDPRASGWNELASGHAILHLGIEIWV